VGNWANVRFLAEPGDPPPPPPPQPESFALTTYPVQGVEPYVTSNFNHQRSYGLHEGIDLRVQNPSGTMPAIIAGQRGIVDGLRTHDPGSGYGKYVRLRHEGFEPGITWKSWYCHLSTVDAGMAVGLSVQAGTVLGLAGSSGNSTGAHLHITIQKMPGGLSGYVIDNVVDPAPLIPALAGTPPPPPPDTTEVDMLPYMAGVLQGNGPLYEIQTSWGPQERVQTQWRDGRWYITKGNEQKANWEERWADDTWIYFGTDTSESETRYYTQRDGDRYGAVWCKRRLAPGTWVQRSPMVTHYYKSDCTVRHSGQVWSFLQFVSGPKPVTFESGIRLEKVVELGFSFSVGGAFVERYLFAQGYGLVGWYSQDGRRSWISEIHEPGQRPDNKPLEIPCLRIS
jgi:hypothetical protein